MPAENMNPVGFAQHDHSSCADDALAAAEARCAAEGLRLTPVRRKVLELLLHERRALGAYAILDHLRDAGFGSQPPVAYRALDFLATNGFVHKIEHLNAFVACAHPGETHSPAFMICRLCDAVAETQSGHRRTGGRCPRSRVPDRTYGTGSRRHMSLLRRDSRRMSLVSVEDISVRYGANTVLSHVNLSIEAGEIVTIVGPNGSGKTTLLRTIVGATRPDSGRVNCRPDLRIGYVPQRLHIDSTLPITVERFMRLTDRVTRNVCKTALNAADVPNLLEHQMARLSGGQFQRVLLARAMINRPEILLLDEATQGLDQPGSATFYRQIEAVRQETGCAVLMASHELHVVMSASDRVICLNGHICCEGAPAVVASAPEYRKLFGAGTGGALALYRHDHDHDHDHRDASTDAVE